MEEKKKKMLKKMLSKDKKKPLSRGMTEEFDKVENKSMQPTDKSDQFQDGILKADTDTVEEKKMNVEERLEESDKVLNNLTEIGNELVTNIKVATEKRELLRRNYEALRREELLTDVKNEALEALAKLDVITAKWSELESIKEPMGLFEELEIQKERIQELMNQKDNLIKECHNEIKRVDEKYYSDLETQSADIYSLVERTDYQTETIKNAFRDHLELLQQTIEDERKLLASEAAKKWEQLYENRIENEKLKMTKEKETSNIYAQELEKVALQHEEESRATRIRLEKDAEALQLELRNVKNNVLLNKEKMDYNYQVLQKRDEENIIIKTQQKKRLTKLNETVSTLRRKIRDTKDNSETEIKRLTDEIVALRSNITDLEAKADNFAHINDRKYQLVWDMNLKEASDMLTKILDIDQILHHQQLGLDWCFPELPTLSMKDLPSYKHAMKQIEQISIAQIESSKVDDRRSDEQKLADTRILRNILRKITDRSGFLVEEKLFEILQPVSEQQKSIFKIDHIFNALDINEMDDVGSLIDYFMPYSWCPNCSPGLNPQSLKQLKQEQAQHFDHIQHLSEDTSDGIDVKEKPSGVEKINALSKDHYVKDTSSALPDSNKTGESVQDVAKDGTERSSDCKTTSSKETKCKNHFYVIEPAFIITALRQFTEKYISKKDASIMPGIPSKVGLQTYKHKMTVSRMLSKSDVNSFWQQFKDIIPEEKEKLWTSVEHGLNHYLQALKERKTLDAECEFLRKQNSELKHLLQKHLMKNPEN